MSENDENTDEVEPMIFHSEYVRSGDPIARAPTAEATGEGAALEVRVAAAAQPEQAPQEFHFRKERVVIGRDPSCDLLLEDPHSVVSGRHAELVREADRLELSDLGSKNSTYVNGKRIEPRTPVEIGRGDEIEIAGFLLKVRWLG